MNKIVFVDTNKFVNIFVVNLTIAEIKSPKYKETLSLEQNYSHKQMPYSKFLTVTDSPFSVL